MHPKRPNAKKWITLEESVVVKIIKIKHDQYKYHVIFKQKLAKTKKWNPLVRTGGDLYTFPKSVSKNRITKL